MLENCVKFNLSYLKLIGSETWVYISKKTKLKLNIHF